MPFLFHHLFLKFFLHFTLLVISIITPILNTHIITMSTFIFPPITNNSIFECFTRINESYHLFMVNHHHLLFLSFIPVFCKENYKYVVNYNITTNISNMCTFILNRYFYVNFPSIVFCSSRMNAL